jgi:hypothetical protein
MILYMSIFCRVVRKWCYLSLILYFSASLRGSGASFELGLVMAMRGLYALVYYSRGFRAANASTVSGLVQWSQCAKAHLVQAAGFGLDDVDNIINCLVHLGPMMRLHCGIFQCILAQR